jgi:O-antigen/teichoic acid export membrane protein
LGWNLRALGISQVLSKLAGLASMVVLARFLGEVDFGRYTAAIALVSLLIVLIEFGTSGYLVREGAQRPDHLGDVLGHVVLLRTMLAALAAAVAIPVGILVGYDTATITAVGLFAVAAGVRMVGAAFVSALQSLELLGAVARMQAELAIAQAAGAAFAVVAGGDVVAVSWAVLGVSALYPLRTWFVLRRNWRGRVLLRLAGFRSTLRVAGYFGIAAGLTTILTYLDAIMIQAFRGNAETGLYGAAYRILLALTFFPAVYSEAANRSIAHLGKSDPDRLGRVSSRIVGHLLMLSAPIAVGGMILSDEILRTLFGAAYGEAGTTLAVLLVALLFVYPSHVTVRACYALGMERQIAGSLMLAVAANAAANLFFIPRWGMVAAAAATLGAEGFVLLMQVYFIRRRGIRFEWRRTAGKITLACFVMGVIVWALRDAPLAFPVAIGATTYIVALLALRAFDEEDREALRAMLRRK